MSGDVIVVVAGLSGAGRTTALSALEDLGFYCVDNLPPSAFAPALEACARDHLTRVAFGVDVRVRSFLDATLGAIGQLQADGSRSFSLLFLEASDAALLARYNTTRRPHPLRAAPQSDTPEAAGARPSSLALVDGIKLERARLAPLRANASLVLDTSDLNVHELRRRVIELFRPGQDSGTGMLTRFVSFGFKYGSPLDLDLLFDVRFIENPHFREALRPLSGLDAAVRDFVRFDSTAQKFREHVEALLRFVLPEYQREGKSYLTVGFGCTGGRHRSVVLAEWVAESLRADDSGFEILVAHRDLERVQGEAVAERAARRLLDEPPAG